MTERVGQHTMNEAQTDIGHGITAEFWVSEEHGLKAINLFHFNETTKEPCACCVYLQIPDHWTERPQVWKVVQSNPLTLEPSVMCKGEGCQLHGYIRNGRWVPA